MVPSLRFLTVLAVFLCLIAPASVAQTGADEPRVALVLGNAAYDGQTLKNPVNDARAVAAALRKLGFQVIERVDAGKKAMEDAILEFGEKLKAGGVGLFYYAGHGMQVRGRNYLVPIDANLPSEAAVRFQAVDIDVVLEQLTEARNRANIVILDACRNNPFAAQARGAPRGLAAIDAARGTLIAYSTAPGRVATDGTGANSPYTSGLVRALEEPGLKAEELFKRVRGYVAEQTKGEQTPWESSSLTGDLVLNLNITVTAPPPSPPANRDTIEAAFWSSIASSGDTADYEEYLRQFPAGVFAGLAKRRIADIARKQAEKPPQQAALPPPKPEPPPAPERPMIAIEKIDKEFVATQGARVREAPDASSKQVAALAAGQAVVVAGKVKDQNWYQVERDGRPVGFVSAPLLEDAAAYNARQAEEKRRQAEAEEQRKRTEEEARKRAEALEKARLAAAAARPATTPQVAAAPVPAPAAAAAPPRQSYRDAGEVRDAVYDKLMAAALGAKVGAGEGIGATYVGKANDYRTRRGAKALAACVDWTADSVAAIKLLGWGTSWNDERPSMGPIRESALQLCARGTKSGQPCACQIVDESDRNVLQVPDAFTQRALQPAALPAATPAAAPAAVPATRPASFDGAWSAENKMWRIDLTIANGEVAGEAKCSGSGTYKFGGRLDADGQISAEIRGIRLEQRVLSGTMPSLKITPGGNCGGAEFKLQRLGPP